MLNNNIVELPLPLEINKIIYSFIINNKDKNTKKIKNTICINYYNLYNIKNKKYYDKINKTIFINKNLIILKDIESLF